MGLEKDDFTAAKTAAEKQMVEVAYEEALSSFSRTGSGLMEITHRYLKRPGRRGAGSFFESIDCRFRNRL